MDLYSALPPTKTKSNGQGENSVRHTEETNARAQSLARKPQGFINKASLVPVSIAKKKVHVHVHTTSAHIHQAHPPVEQDDVSLIFQVMS